MRHLAYRTERAYVAWVKLFILFHSKRHPGQKLEWMRIVDFYHASEYIAKLSQALFQDDDRAAYAW